MPDFAPFRGIRFRPGTDVTACLAPPYDVIGPDLHQQLLDLHPHNTVRWILGEEPGNPFAGDESYRRRAQLFEEWLRDGLLVREEQPCYYLYQHRFQDDEGCQRTYEGVLGAVRVQPWGEGVYPHEHVKTDVVDNLCDLLHAARFNAGVVQLVLADSDSTFRSLIGQAPAELLFEGKDWQGNHHRLLAIRDQTSMVAIAERLRAQPCVVADGHHRYNAAQQFQSRYPGPGSERTLAIVGDLFQEGLRIGPTHRLVLWEPNAAVDPWQVCQHLAKVLDDQEGCEWQLLVPGRDPLQLRSRFDAGRPTLARCLEDELRAAHPESRMEPFHDEERARARMAQWPGTALFCRLPAVTKEEFWRRGSHHEVFPSKTTFFEPKIGTGLVAHWLEEDSWQDVDESVSLSESPP
ncbi:MAG: DUF1015 domain-containing protein [Planctomycetota bacterium]